MLALLTILTDWTWLATGFIGLITLFLVRHLIQVRSLPPGPFPLPVLGNLLALRGEDNDLRSVLDRLQKKHKTMFTLWLGPKPSVFICDWDLIHEATISKKNDFSGRVRRHTLELVLGEDDDVAFTDFGPSWETLRKILVSALRKYTVSEKLADLVTDVVDKTAESLFKDGKPVDTINMMYLIVYNILASSAFGQRFEVDDPEFIRLKKNNDDATEAFGSGLPSDALPILKYFYRNRVAKISAILDVVKSYITLKYKEHKDTYQSGDIRDFTDAILAAREEAEAEGKESLQYLTDGNLTNVMNNLFGAGTDTTRIFLTWIFLIICNKPEVQKKMQEEIDQIIGSRAPVQSDKASCHYVTAVQTEVLRFRPVLDFTLEHRTICDTELGGYKIPKDTSCFVYINSSHTNKTHWDEADKFKPERFLDADGKFTNNRLTSYLPFGLGRRSCPGEKLALMDTFLVVTRLLQRYSFELENGPGSIPIMPDTNSLANITPPYNIVVKNRHL